MQSSIKELFIFWSKSLNYTLLLFEYHNIMSTENLKQLKIKTSMLKRLRKEYQSYDKETKGIQEKISKLEE